MHRCVCVCDTRAKWYFVVVGTSQVAQVKTSQPEYNGRDQASGRRANTWLESQTSPRRTYSPPSSLPHHQPPTTFPTHKRQQQLLHTQSSPSPPPLVPHPPPLMELNIRWPPIATEAEGTVLAVRTDSPSCACPAQVLLEPSTGPALSSDCRAQAPDLTATRSPVRLNPEADWNNIVSSSNLAVKYQYASPQRLYQWVQAQHGTESTTLTLTKPHSPYLSELEPISWLVASPEKYRGRVIQRRQPRRALFKED